MRHFCLTLVAVMMLAGGEVFAISQNDLAFNILHNQELVKELDGRVALPFGDEYQVRLINHNDRRATAKVSIDGVPVSKLGDIVIPANDKVDLERFLDHSLIEGQRFKFVPLTDSRVDDPKRKENGIVRVEFRLEKKAEKIFYLNPEKEPQQWIPLPGWSISPSNLIYDSVNDTITIGTLDTLSASNISTTLTCASSLLSGATIGGSESRQAFRQIDLDVEDRVVVLELRIKGFNKLALK